MRAAIEAEASKAEAGGYLIWTPAESLPSVCRDWAETEAAAILQRSLPAGTPAVRLLGGAALWKRVGVHDGTPFHQDFAYAEGLSAGSSASRATRHVAVWLACLCSTNLTLTLSLAITLSLAATLTLTPTLTLTLIPS